MQCDPGNRPFAPFSGLSNSKQKWRNRPPLQTGHAGQDDGAANALGAGQLGTLFRVIRRCQRNRTACEGDFPSEPPTQSAHEAQAARVGAPTPAAETGTPQPQLHAAALSPSGTQQPSLYWTPFLKDGREGIRRRKMRTVSPCPSLALGLCTGRRAQDRSTGVRIQKHGMVQRRRNGSTRGSGGDSGRT